uniref:Uncharacterized protein n=1 Tax=Eutreptiella gymnastica TaxID=73025 RepID=A0A7S4G094_9EUGL
MADLLYIVHCAAQIQHESHCKLPAGFCKLRELCFQLADCKILPPPLGPGWYKKIILVCRMFLHAVLLVSWGASFRWGQGCWSSVQCPNAKPICARYCCMLLQGICA